MTNPHRFSLDVNGTTQLCPKGQEVGKRYMAAGKIPVISCEGGCIRGEIARLAANIVAKDEPFRRSCHGELLTVPDSAIAQWTMNANKVVVIDGCFLHCHGRILRNIIDDDALEVFDALFSLQEIHRSVRYRRGARSGTESSGSRCGDVGTC